MADVRTALADHARRLLVVVGVALVVIGGVGPGSVGVVSVLGVVALLSALLLAEPVAALLRPGDEASGDALDVLRERYARGDLDHDEFERRVEDLVETEDGEVAAAEYDRERLTE